jgi:hypothetical protein
VRLPHALISAWRTAKALRHTAPVFLVPKSDDPVRFPDVTMSDLELRQKAGKDGLTTDALKPVISSRNLGNDGGIALPQHFNRFANVPESVTMIALFSVNFQKLSPYPQRFWQGNVSLTSDGAAKDLKVFTDDWRCGSGDAERVNGECLHALGHLLEDSTDDRRCHFALALCELELMTSI